MDPAPVGALVLAAGLSRRFGSAKMIARWRGRPIISYVLQTIAAARDAGVLAGYVDQVIAANADQVAQYRAGKDKVLGFLVGQVMKLSGGKANPQRVNALLREKLGRG